MMNVRDFGAMGDGESLDTRAIQSAIDQCSAAGGGVVDFPGGTYLIGTLYMRSHVTIRLESTAVLLGSPDIADYTTDTHRQLYDNEAATDRCLIYSENADCIGFEGTGTIDGQGHLFPPNGGSFQRPMLMRFLNCTNVRLRDLRLRRPASWTTAFILCDTVFVDSVDILSRVNYNGDGLDFDSCQNVFVSNCKFDTSDDSICLQNSERDHACRNVVIENCIMKSQWAAIRIGLLSSGDIEDVTVTNCVFRDTQCSGLKIQSTEGGRIRRMLFSNILMHNVPRPIFITLNRFHLGVNAPAEPPATGAVRDLVFSNLLVTCEDDPGTDTNSGIVIVGTPGQCVQDISISNVRVSVPGGKALPSGQVPEHEGVPELVGHRPEFDVFEGKLPSYGLYARHVRGLRVFDLRLETIRPDCRPAVVCDDAIIEDPQHSWVAARR